jgi:hypothetical protein
MTTGQACWTRLSLVAGSGQAQAQEQEQEQAQQVWAGLPPWALRVWWLQVVRWGRQRARLAMRLMTGYWLAPRQQSAVQAFGRMA